MIQLVNLNYKENLELDMLITKYANENLEEIIHFAWDYIQDSSDVECFSPPRLYMKSKDECRLNIKELWGFAQDSILRSELSPIYQFHLYKIIDFYIDIFSQVEEDALPSNGPIIVSEMDSVLKEKVVEQYGESAVSRFSDVRSYLEEFFYDWDFDPEFLAGAVQLCLDKSSLFHSLTSLKELEKYVGLMDGDTFQKYQSLCEQKDEENDARKDAQVTLDADLKKALLSIQKNPQYWNLDENDLNDRLRDLLGMKYHVDDQSRQGVSLSQKSVGEIDFLVSASSEPIAIMEALKLNSVDKGYIKDHIEKLLVNYDPQGYPRASIIMYVTCKDFGAFWSGFANYISEFNFPYPIDTDFSEGHSSFSESKHAYMILLRSNTPILLSFHAIHLREKEK